MARARYLYKPAQDLTARAQSTILGNRFVKIHGTSTYSSASGTLVSVTPATAGTDIVFGVAEEDAAAAATVGVLRGGVVTVEAGEAIGAGVRVMAGAAGVAMVHTGVNLVAGVALASAALGADVPVALSL
jgi:hypothetical protein